MRLHSFFRRRVLLSLVMVLVILVASLQPVSAAATIIPNSMVALGDSITLAYNTGSLFTSAPANSWSTGTNSTVNSLYLRFYSLNPKIRGKNYNYAVSGAKMADLNGQAAKVTSKIPYVTILMGANDVCTSSEATMTPVSTFAAQFQTAVNTIKAKSPNATIYVVSIPNIYQLWSVLKDSSSARSAWSVFGICQSMLANPTSTNQSDVDRRARVSQRNMDFNTQLAQICAKTAKCYFDNNAAYNTTFTASDVSTRDYFHPSLAGQAKLANVAWGAAP